MKIHKMAYTIRKKCETFYKQILKYSWNFNQLGPCFITGIIPESTQKLLITIALSEEDFQLHFNLHHGYILTHIFYIPHIDKLTSN